MSWLKTLVIASAAALGGAALAFAHGGDGSKVHACAAGVGQPLVLSDAAGNGCANAPQQIDWAQVGPQGVAGPAGSAGPPGATGPAGAQGPAGPSQLYSRVVTKRSALDAATFKQVFVTCPGSSFATGGGAELDGMLSGRSIYRSAPYRNGWIAAGALAINTVGSVPWAITVYATCVDVKPVPPQPGPPAPRASVVAASKLDLGVDVRKVKFARR